MTPDEMREICRRLRTLARELGSEANEQHDCCHGETAKEVLDNASKTCLDIARGIERAELDILRAQLR